MHVNGKGYAIISDKDILELIEEHCGSEVSKLVGSKIESVDLVERTVQLRAETDAEAYLMDLEKMNGVILDTCNDLEDIIKDLGTSKRLDTAKLAQKLDLMHTSLITKV